MRLLRREKCEEALEICGSENICVSVVSLMCIIDFLINNQLIRVLNEKLSIKREAEGSCRAG